MTEIRIALQPKQRLFLDSVTNIRNVLFGGAKGGGKSHILRNGILLRRFQFPGTTGAIFRKSYPELERNHIRKLFQEHPQLKAYWNDSKKVLTLPNGSVMEFCYAKNVGDLSHYQGAEFHDLGIDEAGEWPEEMYRILSGSNRSSIPGVKPRTMLTGNPGGLGHVWLKRIFIQRRFTKLERPGDYHFIQALVDDNAALMDNDPDYVHALDANPNEALRKAYRFGDWDVFAGQFFQELDRETHFIEPFPIPDHWNRFGSYDYGFNHNATFGWFAVDGDGNVYLYRELVKQKHRVDQFAELVNKHEDSKLLYPVVAGHDCFHVKKAKINKDEAPPPTIAEEFLSHGISLKPATISRIPGASNMRSYLARQTLEGKSKKPKFFIFNTCPITFECLARMIIDPDHPEDVLKVDASEGDVDTGDDCYDMTRYGLMSRPATADPVVVKHPAGSKGWYEEQNRINWEAEREKLVESAGNWPEQPENPWGIL